MSDACGGHVRKWIERLRQRGSGSRGRADQPAQEAEDDEEIGADVPHVCIVTPVFNGAEFIDETIQSVLAQSGDFVLHYHVQDGGSTDGTMARVEHWMRAGRTMPRRCRKIVFTCVSEADTGMYDAINKGFTRALPPGGDVVMGWIAADDQLAPGAFAAILAIRAQHPGIRLLGGRISLMDLNGSILGVNALLPFAQSCMAAGLYDGRALNFIMQEGTFWCSDLWHKVGGLDTDFRLAGDWDLWRRMAAHEAYVSADTLLGFHRKRPGQLSEQMDRYYGEVDNMLDGTANADGASLRLAYEKAMRAYDTIKGDPQRFHGSGYAAQGVRFDLGTRRWALIESIGLSPGTADLVTPSGTTESVPVRTTVGFKPAEGPYPEHALPAAIRWMAARHGEGELLLMRAGRYRIVLRCRSWALEQSVVIQADGQPLGRLAVTPHGHDRDVFLLVDATLAAGLHTLAITIEQPAHDTRYLLVTGWWAERLICEDHAAILPVPARPIDLASRAWAPAGAVWPRISLIIWTCNTGPRLHDMLQSVVRQGYPELELIVVDSNMSEQTACILRQFAGHIAHLVAESDCGDGDAFQKGMLAASGALIGRLGSGDLLADGALHAVGHAILSDGDIDIVVGTCEMFDGRGVALHRRVPDVSQGASALDPSGVFFKRQVWERAGNAGDHEPLARLDNSGATIRMIGAPVMRRSLAALKSGTPQNVELPKRLRILFFSDGFDEGAVSTQRALFKALAALGHEIIVLGYSDFRGGSEMWTVDAETVGTAIAAFAPNLVFIGKLDHIAGDLDVVGALAKRGIPTVQHARPPVHVCPIGVDTQRFMRGDRWRARMLLDLTQDAFIIVTPAADLPEQRKALALLVAALELAAETRELMLLVIGSAPVPVDLPFPVRVTGDIENEALVALYYQAADLFVSASDAEGFSRAVLDAGASELPAVVLVSDGIVAPVLEGVTGLCVREQSSTALSAAIAALRSDAGLRRQMGVQARLDVLNRFSLEATATALTAVLAHETGLDPEPDVCVAIERPAPPAPRYLVEAGGTVPQRVPLWYPGRNFAEQRQPTGRPDLPLRFWSATSPDCAFLVMAGISGGHTLQLVVRSPVPRQRLSISINNSTAQTLVLAADYCDTPQIIQIGVDLVSGFNRVAIVFAAPPENGEPGLLFEDVAIRPGLPASGEGLQSDVIRLLHGFEPPEGPYPELGLPELIRWASGRRCTVQTIAATAGQRRWELRLSNNRPNQAIRITVNDRLVASRTIEDRPLTDATLVVFEAVMLAGTNLITIEADQLLESIDDPRPLAFILVSLRPVENNAPIAHRSAFHWDLSRGLGAPRDMKTGSGSALVRPVEAQDCTIVVEREQPGPARLRLEVVTALPVQTASMLVNGRPLRPLGLSTGTAGAVLVIERDVTLIGGLNTLQLRFDLSPAGDGALLYLREVLLDHTAIGTAAAPSNAFAAA